MLADGWWFVDLYINDWTSEDLALMALRQQASSKAHVMDLVVPYLLMYWTGWAGPHCLVPCGTSGHWHRQSLLLLQACPRLEEALRRRRLALDANPWASTCRSHFWYLWLGPGSFIETHEETVDCYAGPDLLHTTLLLMILLWPYGCIHFS